MEKVIIFGIGDISQIAYLYLSENKNYEIVAFTIDKEYIKEDTFLGLPVVAFENLEEKFSQNEYKLFIPLSYTKINKLREQKFLESLGTTVVFGDFAAIKNGKYLRHNAQNLSDKIISIAEDNREKQETKKWNS